MEDRGRALGLLLQAVARARREAVYRAIRAHGMEELEERAAPWLLDGRGGAPEEETERLMRICRVVDEGLVEGLTGEERMLLGGMLARLLRTLREPEAFSG